MSPYIEKSYSFKLPVGNNFYLAFMRTLRQQDIVSFLVVFVSIFAALKFNQYLFFTFNTTPAIIFLPTGIALAAVYLGGCRLWMPIAAAWLLATLTSPAQPLLVVVVASALAYTLQAVIGAYALKRLDFLGTMGRTRCALILIITGLILPVFAPTITASAQWLTHSLPASFAFTWSRAWAGGVLNIIIFTPLITSWYHQREWKSRAQLMESALALLALALAVYLTFWTQLPQANVFLVLYGLFAVLFWIGLRMRPRITTLALFLLAAFGMAGSIIAHPTATPLNTQLFADELFVVLIAPIFFILSALVDERRVETEKAEAHAAEFEQANRRLSQEDRAKNDFLATLAHELRNPLAPVVSSLELIKLQSAELHQPELVAYADIAQDHVSMLARLLDDLLDISRISHRKFKIHKEQVELRSAVKPSLRSVDALYKARNHILSISIPKEKIFIEADPLRFGQILINLLNNAAKYTAPGGYIELSIVHDSERGLRVSVKDNGIGIEPGMLSKIFEPFIQSTDGSAGLGIGLSLTKRLVELHGGQIWCESEGLGKGSDFIFVLPNIQQVPLPLAAPHPAKRRSGRLLFDTSDSHIDNAEKKAARTYTIVITDDNRAAAEGLKILLEHAGHSVFVAHDGPTAIEMTRKAKAEVAVLDIGLPGMDGYTVARKLRQEYGYKPLLLIALSGYGQEEDKARAEQAGFNYHLTKPVSVADIEALLGTVSQTA